MPIDTRHPRGVRAAIRRGKLAGITAGLGQNFVQANLAVLPRDWAYDFLVFCQRNPRPCPLLEGTDATPYWRDDLVAFLLGCSFTFEWALLEAGIRLWHVEQGRNVAMWRTSIPCRPAGRLHGPLVVSKRPVADPAPSKAGAARARP